MQKLRNLLGFNKVNGDFGMEFEIEGSGLVVVDNPFVKTEKDGSLRGVFPSECAEYVFKKPLDFKTSIDVTERLFKYLTAKGAKFNYSFRTSTHVHLNASEMTIPQILNTIYTYYLIEDVLMEFCGDERKANRFCLTAGTAEGILDVLHDIFNNNLAHRRIEFLNGELVRYSALNLHALTKYGSLEFRGLGGTNDVGKIKSWLTAIYNLREYASSLPNVKHVYNNFIELGPTEFLKRVLGDAYEAFKIPNQDKLMNHSFSITLDLAYANTPEE